VFFEGRDGEQGVGGAAGVAMPLVHLGRGIAIAQQQQVDLIARGAVLDHGPDVAGPAWMRHPQECDVENKGLAPK
jgi:hypothetical protein